MLSGGGVSSEKQIVAWLVLKAVDKDFASQRLAELVEADLFIVLTGVDYVFVWTHNKPDQEKLEHVVSLSPEYIKQVNLHQEACFPKVNCHRLCK